MFIGLLHVNKKITETALCQHCKELIKVGELHALVMTRFGKVQEAVQKLRRASLKRDKFEEPTGKRRVGKREGLRYSRLHMACLGKWMIVYHLHKSEWRKEHRRGGRPDGTGALHQLSNEVKLHRRRLVRRRAELYRQILITEDPIKLEQSAKKLIALKVEIEATGVGIVKLMNRRDEQRTKIIHEKLKRFLS